MLHLFSHKVGGCTLSQGGLTAKSTNTIKNFQALLETELLINFQEKKNILLEEKQTNKQICLEN